MSTYKSQYKANNGFGDIKNNRALNKKICEIKRKGQRVENFSKQRDLEDITDVAADTDKKDSRYYKLLKWKAERDRRKKKEQTTKKPAFKVGVVHHNYYSPPIKDSILLSPMKQCLHGRKQITRPATPSKKITTATQKRLLQKSMASNKVPQVQSVTEKRQEISTGKETEKVSVKNKKSFVPNNYKFTAPSGLANMTLFGRATMLRTPVKSLTSIKKENSAEVFISKTKFKSSDTEDNIAEINEEDKASNIDTTDESIEAITLKISCDEHETTFDNSVKGQEILRKNSSSCNNKSPIISPCSILSITQKKETMTEKQSNNDTEISSVRNIAETKAEDNIPKNGKQLKITPPLENVSYVSNDTNLPKDPVFFSPYIVSSRGKSNARKEQQIRRGINCSPSEDIPTKDTVMKTLNISIEEEERTAQYFSFMLNKEIDRLNELCEKWTEIQSELGITEDAQYQINQAIGQTNLLINKKFERFRRLVLDCETGKGEMLVTCRDLQGFWDMMYMEVMNCDSRFKKLEELRSNGWKEEDIAIRKVVPSKKVRSKKKIISKSKSTVQDFILAAKQKMKNKTENLEVLKDHMNESINKLSTSINNIDIEQNKSEILRKNDTKQSVSRNSKDRLSLSDKKVNSRQSLLQKTLLSESCKTIKTPMTIMKISQMCKTPKIELDDTISYINSKQTPSKSILKRTDDSTMNESRYTKSVQKVNFNDHVISQEVPIDKEIQNKLDLAARLARIDNYDLDAEYTNYSIRAEKKLNFDDNSFLDLESNSKWDSELLDLPEVTKKDDTPLNAETKLSENISSKSENMSLKESPNQFTQNETNIRILRNRVVVTDKSTRISTARRSNKGSADEDNGNQKENEIPVKLEKRSSRFSKQIEPITKKETLNVTPAKLKKDLRRSSRKSVRFNAEECRACTDYKPIHPVTPHTRHSKGNLNLSYLQNISPVQLPSSNADLISWDSPKISVRRSSRRSNKHFV